MTKPIYRVMVVQDTPQPRLYLSCDNKQLASNTMRSLDKKGYFTYISIEYAVATKPKLYVVPKPVIGYNSIFLKGV